MSDDTAGGWGTPNLLNAGPAQIKDRRGLAWFLLSLFVGLFATLLLLVLPLTPRPSLPG